MDRNIKIRHARQSDAPDVAELIYATSLACCFTADQPCPEWYKESVNSSHIAELINQENMAWLVASLDNSLVGVLAISEGSHVKYFFVNPAYQNLGIGKQLWNAAFEKGALGNALTVRSSLNAVPVYERLGFVAVEPPRVFNGLHYQTMVAKNG